MGPREEAFGSLRKVGRRRHRRHRRGEGVLRRFGIVSLRTSLRALFPPSLAFAFAFVFAFAVQDLQGFADALFGARGERGGASRGARVFRGESARFFVDAPRAAEARRARRGTPRRHATPASRAAVTADWRRVRWCAKGFSSAARRRDAAKGGGTRPRARRSGRRPSASEGEDGEATRSSASADGAGGRRAKSSRAAAAAGAAGGGDQGPPRGEVRRERVRRGRGRGSRRSRRPPSVVLGAPAPAPPVARGGGSSALRSREDPDARVGAPAPLIRASRHVHVVGDALPLRRGGHPGARGSVTPARRRRWAARDAESSERKMDFSEAVSAVVKFETAARSSS